MTSRSNSKTVRAAKAVQGDVPDDSPIDEGDVSMKSSPKKRDREEFEGPPGPRGVQTGLGGAHKSVAKGLDWTEVVKKKKRWEDSEVEARKKVSEITSHLSSLKENSKSSAKIVSNTNPAVGLSAEMGLAIGRMAGEFINKFSGYDVDANAMKGLSVHEQITPGLTKDGKIIEKAWRNVKKVFAFIQQGAGTEVEEVVISKVGKVLAAGGYAVMVRRGMRGTDIMKPGEAYKCEQGLGFKSGSWGELVNSKALRAVVTVRGKVELFELDDEGQRIRSARKLPISVYVFGPGDGEVRHEYRRMTNDKRLVNVEVGKKEEHGMWIANGPNKAVGELADALKKAGIEILRGQSSHDDFQVRFRCHDMSLLRSMRAAFQVSIIEMADYCISDGERVFALSGEDVYRAPQRLGITKWIAAGKSRIWVFANPEQWDKESMDALVKLGVRGWDTEGNTLHAIQRKRDAASIMTVIENVPLCVGKSTVLEALSIEKKLYSEFFVVSNGDVFSYNIETKVKMTSEWHEAMKKLDDCIVVRSLEEEEVEWDW